MGYPKTMDMNTALNEALDAVNSIHRLCQEYNYPLLGMYAICASSRLTEILDEHDPLREICPIPDNFDKLFTVTAKLERK